MKRKCPFCGSNDVAQIKISNPEFSEQQERDIEDNRIELGERCIPGNDPSFHCNACGKNFGKPPYLRRHKGQSENAPLELIPDVVTGIVFSEGGYFGGYDYIEITSKKGKYHSVYTHYPDLSGNGPYVQELTVTQWKRLLDTLFYKLYIHEWEKRYVNPHVLDGTQWSIRLTLMKGRHFNITGSNNFPVLYKDLVRALKPYMKNRKRPQEDQPELRRCVDCQQDNSDIQ